MANDRSTRTCVTSSRRLPASPGLARTRGTKSGRLSRHSGFGRRGRGMRGGSPENREPSPGVDRRASCRFLVVQLTRILPRSSRSSGTTAMSCARAMRCSSAAAGETVRRELLHECDMRRFERSWTNYLRRPKERRVVNAKDQRHRGGSLHRWPLAFASVELDGERSEDHCGVGSPP